MRRYVGSGGLCTGKLLLGSGLAAKYRDVEGLGQVSRGCRSLTIAHKGNQSIWERMAGTVKRQ